jgi:hypothetical protein
MEAQAADRQALAVFAAAHAGEVTADWADGVAAAGSRRVFDDQPRAPSCNYPCRFDAA